MHTHTHIQSHTETHNVVFILAVLMEAVKLEKHSHRQRDVKNTLTCLLR